MGIVGHGGIDPAHFVRDAEFVHQCKRRSVRLTHKMVKPLDGGSGKIKVRGHAADLAIGFDQINFVTKRDRALRSRKSHRSSSKYNDTTHGSSPRTTA